MHTRTCGNTRKQAHAPIKQNTDIWNKSPETTIQHPTTSKAVVENRQDLLLSSSVECKTCNTKIHVEERQGRLYYGQYVSIDRWNVEEHSDQLILGSRLKIYPLRGVPEIPTLWLKESMFMQGQGHGGEWTPSLSREGNKLPENLWAGGRAGGWGGRAGGRPGGSGGPGI